MKILFICGSLEPGCDGVGDYTRRLAGELIRQGHQAAIVSLCDRGEVSGCPKPNEEPIVQCDGLTDVPTYRYGVDVPWTCKHRSLSSLLSTRSPDIASLQYVPHAFQVKGLPFSLGKNLASLDPSIRWHIMCHELWVQRGVKASVKQNALSWVQQQILTQLVRQLSPLLITTSNYEYRDRLRWLKVDVLPIFSTIRPYEKAGVSDANHRSDEFSLAVFGSLTQDMSGFEDQLHFVCQLAKRIGQTPILHAIGRRPECEAHFALAESILGPGTVVDHGPMADQELSQRLHVVDFGISRADAALFPKSATTLAFLEHGVPVLLRGDRILSKDLAESRYRRQIYFCNDTLAEVPLKEQPHSGLKSAAVRFSELVTGCLADRGDAE